VSNRGLANNILTTKKGYRWQTTASRNVIHKTVGKHSISENLKKLEIVLAKLIEKNSNNFGMFTFDVDSCVEAAYDYGCCRPSPAFRSVHTGNSNITVTSPIKYSSRKGFQVVDYNCGADSSDSAM